MSAKPEDLLLQASKTQLDAALRMMESVTEAAIRIHEAQLEAATEAHADVEATRKAIAAATDASQLMKLCGEFARANAAKSFTYWRSLAQAGMPEAPSGMLKLDTIDGAYKQWLDGLQQLYKPFQKSGT